MDSKLFTIWVTKDCNLRCTYCYEKNKENKSMTQKTAYDTAEYIKKNVRMEMLQKCEIHFHGGEPLLAYSQIKILVTELKKEKSCNFHFSITTNGTILNEEITNFLLKNFETISISIDGKKETHDNQRKNIGGLGTYDIVFQNAKKLQEKNKFLRIRMTVNVQNVENFYSNVLFFVEQGFFAIDPAVDFFDVWENDSVEILKQQIFQIKEYFIKHHIEINFELINTEFALMNGCGAGSKKVNIDINGALYPCTFTVGNSMFNIGNIYTGVKLDKLNGILSKCENEFRDCDGCTMKKYCIATGCRLLQYILENTWEKVSPIFCRRQWIKYELWEKLNKKS